jgi:hypothetical protein
LQHLIFRRQPLHFKGMYPPLQGQKISQARNRQKQVDSWPEQWNVRLSPSHVVSQPWRRYVLFIVAAVRTSNPTQHIVMWLSDCRQGLDW